MDTFSDQVEKLLLTGKPELMKQQQTTLLTHLQLRQNLDTNLENLLMLEKLNVKDPTTIQVFGQIVKKTAKVEKDFKFITKFLDEFKFFKELREELSSGLYSEMLKKIKWQAVEPYQFLFSKSNHDKKKNKITNNFYIVIEGEVMEFQQLLVENDNYKQSVSKQKINIPNNSNNPSSRPSSHINLDNSIIADSHYMKVMNSSQKNGFDQKDKLYGSPRESQSNLSSNRNSQQDIQMTRRYRDSIKQLNEIDDSMKKVIERQTPRGISRQNSCAYLDKVEFDSENTFIKSVNEYIDSTNNSNNKKNKWKVLSLTTKAVLSFKSNINSPNHNRSQKGSIFALHSKEHKKSIGTPLLTSMFSKKVSQFNKDAKEKEGENQQKDLQIPSIMCTPSSDRVNYDGDYNFDKYLEDEDDNNNIENNIEDEEEDEKKILLEIQKYFHNMKLRTILKEGDHFGEFDDGNLNLISQGYMSKKKACLVYLSFQNYNQLIQIHQNQIIEKKIKFLQQFSFFRSYSKQKMRNYLKYFQNVTYYRNNVVYQEQDPANYIYFILSGEIEFSRLFKLENQAIVDFEEKEQIIPLNKLNVQNFNMAFNPFEKQEKEMYHLNQGKQHREKSQLIKRIHSFVLGVNQYFGEKEVLTNSFRLTQAKVQSVKLEVLQLPSQLYYEQFYCPEIHEICMQESQLREIEQLKIFEEIQSRQPIQNIVQKLEQDYLTDFVKNNNKQQNSQIHKMLKKIPPHIPLEIMKKKSVPEVVNFKDTYLNKQEFNELVSQEQYKKTNRYMREIRECKILFLSKFMDYKSKFSSEVEALPFYDHVKTYVESTSLQPQKNIPLKSTFDNKMRNMLNYCTQKNTPTHNQKNNKQTQNNNYLQNYDKHQINPQNSFQNSQNTSQNSQNTQQNKTLINSQNTQNTQNIKSTKILFSQNNEKLIQIRTQSSSATPIKISQMKVSRQQQEQAQLIQNAEQRKKEEQQRREQMGQQLNQELHSIYSSPNHIISPIPISSKPISISSAITADKQILQRYSFQSETSPNSQVTCQTTRVKNSSIGSYQSNQLAPDYGQFTILTNSDSCKEDFPNESQLFQYPLKQITFTDNLRRQTTPNIISIKNQAPS